jgi:hypothetical protein
VPRPSLANQQPRTLPHDRIQGKRESICLPDADPREKVLYKAELSEQGEGIMPRTWPRRSRQPAGTPPNL